MFFVDVVSQHLESGSEDTKKSPTSNHEIGDYFYKKMLFVNVHLNSEKCTEGAMTGVHSLVIVMVIVNVRYVTHLSLSPPHIFIVLLVLFV